MQYVRVREKHQVTLPMSIVRDAHIQQNDMLEVGYKNGVITLTAKQAQRPKRSLMEFVGAAKGVYGADPAQVLAYLDQERHPGLQNGRCHSHHLSYQRRLQLHAHP